MTASPLKHDTQLASGIFTVSVDFELIWGTLDKPKHRRFRRLCTIERQEVIDCLLELFRKYGISATWCTVGHLFLTGDQDPGARRPAGGDPGIFYGRDLIAKIRNCAVPQEIGTHTFTHRVFNDPACTRAVADEEIASCTRAAGEMGLRLTSFVYPRNRIAHVDLLAKHGFTAFRGQDPCWYQQASRRRWYHRMGHLIDILAATTPPAVLPVWRDEGIWEIPGSMLYTPSHGLRRIVPVRARVKRAKRGLQRAADEKAIFHLWFHPTDLVVRKKAMLEGLRQTLEAACELKEQGKLTFLPMSGIAGLMESRRRRPASNVFEEAICR